MLDVLRVKVQLKLHRLKGRWERGELLAGKKKGGESNLAGGWSANRGRAYAAADKKIKDINYTEKVGKQNGKQLSSNEQVTRADARTTKRDLEGR